MSATDIVTAVAYNARGQRSEVDYGNDVVSTFEYDDRSFRVRRIHTERPNNDPDLRTVQDLRYHYDAVGNITRIRDDSPSRRLRDLRRPPTPRTPRPSGTTSRATPTTPWATSSG